MHSLPRENPGRPEIPSVILTVVTEAAPQAAMTAKVPVVNIGAVVPPSCRSVRNMVELRFAAHLDPERNGPMTPEPV